MKLKLNQLSTTPPEYTDIQALKSETERYVKRIADLQEALMAEQKNSMLIILQGTDSSGKDGTVKHVFTGINPSGVHVTSWKVPTADEYAHDYLWRIHKEVPPRGKIHIFNRSHYEDILVPSVHNLFPDKDIKLRYDHINNFEKMLTDTGTVILKFFLHISPEVQQERFKKRMHNPKKYWKFKKKDVNESKHWDEYQKVYEKIIDKCPGWIIVPADNKHYRNYIIAKHVFETLKKLKPKFPNKITD